MHKKKCEHCGQEFQARRDDARFCSSTCKARAWDQRKQKNDQEPVMSREDNLSSKNQCQEEQLGRVKAGMTKENVECLGYRKKLNFLQHTRQSLVKKRSQLYSYPAKLTNSGLRQERILPIASTGHPVMSALTHVAISVGYAYVYPSLKKSLEEKIKEKIGKINLEIKDIDVRLTSLDREITIQQNLLKECQEKGSQKAADPMNSGNLTNPAGQGTPVQIRPKDVNFTGNDNPVDMPSSTAPTNKIRSSLDVGYMEFKVLELASPWQEFLGNPANDFSMAIHGLPGQGKSTFAIQHAMYLAENHGKVIYITAEEGFSKTMQDKLKLNQAFHPDLHIADLRSIEEIFAEPQMDTYTFIFIDSLNKLHIDPDTLRELRKRYKRAGFITVSQSTKDGKLRGSQEILHDCDIEIVVKSGIAVSQKNRYYQTPREFKIFQ